MNVNKFNERLIFEWILWMDTVVFYGPNFSIFIQAATLKHKTSGDVPLIAPINDAVHAMQMSKSDDQRWRWRFERKKSRRFPLPPVWLEFQHTDNHFFFFFKIKKREKKRCRKEMKWNGV